MATTEHDIEVAFHQRGGRLVGQIGDTRFRLDEASLSQALCTLPRLEADWFRIVMAVYCTDRLARRRHRAGSPGMARIVKLTVPVEEPDFWRSSDTQSLVQEAIEQLSADVWRFEFAPAPLREFQPCFRFSDEPVVCLYSGGLDSAAGLANRLREQLGPVVTVTARHQSYQSKNVRDQIQRLRDRYGADLHPVLVTAFLLNAGRLDMQETSQRCRSFTFASLAGAVACAIGASEVEVYESGVGALNLPLMNGMLSGGYATRGCHPRFLRVMSELATQIAGRPIRFVLPFRDYTKAEVVRTLAEDGLQDLAVQTASCVHYPLRVRGNAKQCGYCPACLGRRQALATAGIPEEADRYQYDLFSPNFRLGDLPSDRLAYLKATVMQIAALRDLEGGQPTPLLLRHVRVTRIVEPGESIGPWIDVMARYRREWLKLIAE